MDFLKEKESTFFRMEINSKGISQKENLAARVHLYLNMVQHRRLSGKTMNYISFLDPLDCLPE